MTQALHEVDEETDMGAYGAYLRAQTDGDLFDIVQHLDAERYPARLHAARREFGRRRVLSLPVYTTGEYAVRYAALAAFALAAVAVALTLLLTPADAAGPSWLSDIPDGTTALAIERGLLVGTLRGLVTWSVHLGLYPILWGALGVWTLVQSLKPKRRRTKADVRRLVVAAWLALTAAMLLAVVPDSAVPDLFSAGDWPRAFTLWNPFG